eukprot:1146833-Pelagomonas_calceolata.AAC.3
MPAKQGLRAPSAAECNLRFLSKNIPRLLEVSCEPVTHNLRHKSSACKRRETWKFGAPVQAPLIPSSMKFRNITNVIEVHCKE